MDHRDAGASTASLTSQDTSSRARLARLGLDESVGGPSAGALECPGDAGSVWVSPGSHRNSSCGPAAFDRSRRRSGDHPRHRAATAQPRSLSARIHSGVDWPFDISGRGLHTGYVLDGQRLATAAVCPGDLGCGWCPDRAHRQLSGQGAQQLLFRHPDRLATSGSSPARATPWTLSSEATDRSIEPRARRLRTLSPHRPPA